MYVKAYTEAVLSRVERPGTLEAYHSDVDYLRRYHENAGQDLFLDDAYASFSADLGPGSLAIYLGAEPVFLGYRLVQGMR